MENKLINKLNFVCCSRCKKDLFKSKNLLICNFCQKRYEIIDNNILRVIPNLTRDLKLSIDKWDEFYKRINVSYEHNKYMRDFFQDAYNQLSDASKINKKLTYLEIGCGPFFLGQEVAKKVNFVIGIDFCLTPLLIAKKMLEKEKANNYLLIQGDILDMPLKDNIIDLIYGGGVIEHFQNTQKCVDELYRVLKPGGTSLNAVPYLNIGALTYRQVWGNIPNFPILRQMAEFIHIHLLKGKHLTFGYELSFLGRTLIKIHEKAGFSKIRIDKYKIKLAFDFIPFRTLKKILVYIADNYRLFWPMVKVVASK